MTRAHLATDSTVSTSGTSHPSRFALRRHSVSYLFTRLGVPELCRSTKKCKSCHYSPIPSSATAKTLMARQPPLTSCMTSLRATPRTALSRETTAARRKNGAKPGAKTGFPARSTVLKGVLTKAKTVPSAVLTDFALHLGSERRLANQAR